jgi:UDP-N-acetylglucosamine 2-epimerase (non-hydrolysing)
MSGQHSESIEDLFRDFEIQSDITRLKSFSEKETIVGLVMWLPIAVRSCYKYVSALRENSGARPLVVVHGDTLSTFATALAGRLAGGEIVHLESGLTSGKLLDPFPEEVIRRLTFRLAHYAICPSIESSSMMRRYKCREIVNTEENTLLDAVRYALRKTERQSEVAPSNYFVASIHRVQNIYDKSSMSQIIDEIVALSSIGSVHFVLHPATQRRLTKMGLIVKLRKAPNVVLESRMPYTRFVSLLAGARGVLSDGGSNQEELSYLGVPTVLFRARSERSSGLGSNIVFRHMISEDLNEYVVSGKLDSMRTPRHLLPNLQPSQRVLDALQRWCSAEPPEFQS